MNFLIMSGLSTIISTQPRKNDKQINIFVNSEQFLIFIAYICEVLIKTNSSNVIQKMAKLIQWDFTQKCF